MTLLPSAPLRGETRGFSAGVGGQEDLQQQSAQEVEKATPVCQEAKKMTAGCQELGNSKRRRPPSLEEPVCSDLELDPDLYYAKYVTPLEKFSGSNWQRQLSGFSACSNRDTWMEPGESLLFFDWDDTLCPTTYIREDPRLKMGEVAPCFQRTPAAPGGSEEDPKLAEMRALLEQHANTVRAVLTLATSVAHVVVVTLAEAEWVQDSIRQFMPSLDGLFEKLGIQVMHARSAPRPRFLSDLEGQDLGHILKRQTMAWAARHFYGTGKGGQRAKSWKNLLSIGDSDVERLALQDVVFRRVQRDRRGNWKECRCKTLKFLEGPGLEQLTGQLQSLLSWLSVIVQYDGDLDIDFGKELEDGDVGCPTSPGQP